MGPYAREAVPALINALTDNQTRIRRAAADALGKVGPADECSARTDTKLKELTFKCGFRRSDA